MNLDPNEFAKDWHDPSKPWNRPGPIHDAELIRNAVDEDQKAEDAQENNAWSPKSGSSSETKK